jgi:hypothetical protein
MTRITHATRIAAEQLVEKTFATVEAEQRIESARRHVDAEAVALEQWERFFVSGQYRRAAAWWQQEVQGAK